jgi:hypothetical protein
MLLFVLLKISLGLGDKLLFAVLRLILALYV